MKRFIQELLFYILGKRLDSFGQRGIRATHFSFEDINNKGDLNERVTDALAIASCINAHACQRRTLRVR